MYYFCSGGQTSRSHGVAFYAKYTDQLFCNFKENTNNWKISFKNIEKLVWYHMIATWNRIDGARLYTHGVLVDTTENPTWSSYIPSGYDTMEIGRPNNYAIRADGRHFGEAYLDDMYIFEHDVDDDNAWAIYISYF